MEGDSMAIDIQEVFADPDLNKLTNIGYSLPWLQKGYQFCVLAFKFQGQQMNNRRRNSTWALIF